MALSYYNLGRFIVPEGGIVDFTSLKHDIIDILWDSYFMAAAVQLQPIRTAIQRSAETLQSLPKRTAGNLNSLLFSERIYLYLDLFMLKCRFIFRSEKFKFSQFFFI
jgi:hypothetical protein